MQKFGFFFLIPVTGPGRERMIREGVSGDGLARHAMQWQVCVT